MAVRERTSQEAGLPVAVAVAVADDAGLHEGAAPDRRDAVRVVVRQVEVAAEPEAHAGVRLREADEGGGVAGVVQPRAPVFDVHLLDHLRSGTASCARAAAATFCKPRLTYSRWSSLVPRHEGSTPTNNRLRTATDTSTFRSMKSVARIQALCLAL